ncbi:hypothetical protein VTK56DRAFT_6711 [Thermocarpiscus australiensis]
MRLAQLCVAHGNGSRGTDTLHLYREKNNFVNQASAGRHPRRYNIVDLLCVAGNTASARGRHDIQIRFMFVKLRPTHRVLARDAQFRSGVYHSGERRSNTRYQRHQRPHENEVGEFNRRSTGS